MAVLFAAWQSRPRHARLLVVGGGAVPSDLSLPEGVELLGERPIDETYGLIAGAKALVLPAAWAEPFGRVVIEAFALGTPVISSSAGALPELVRHEVTGLLVAVGDSEALAAAIDRVSLDASLRERLSRNALRAYREKFTEQVNNEQLVAIYKRAIAIRERDAPLGRRP